LLIKCDDLNPEEYHYWNSSTDNGIVKAKDIINQRAKDALANNNYIRIIDGEVIQTSAVKYKQNYLMGDLVTLKGAEGSRQTARVVEYIYSEDATGEKEYPTITVVD
jgi:hypothetical protein